MSDTEKTCATCAHWIKRPVDPRNLGKEQGGECRGGPPQIIVVPAQQGAAVMCQYPILPPNFPACAKHEAGES